MVNFGATCKAGIISGGWRYGLAAYSLVVTRYMGNMVTGKEAKVVSSVFSKGLLTNVDGDFTI